MLCNNAFNNFLTGDSSRQNGKGSSEDDNCENIVNRITEQCDSVIKKAQNPGTEVKIQTLLLTLLQLL